MWVSCKYPYVQHTAMSATIRVDARTARLMKEASIVHNADGEPTEPYDSIIRRALVALKTQQQTKKIDVSKL